MTTASAFSWPCELKVELLPRVVREGAPTYAKTPADLLPLLGSLASSSQEVFAVVTLNARNRVIGVHAVTVGLLDSAQVAPREVFRRAITDGAAAVVLAHCHPSGDATPSAEDLHVTRKMIEAGSILDIKVMDHVIIGEDTDGAPRLVSMREAGLVQF